MLFPSTPRQTPPEVSSQPQSRRKWETTQNETSSNFGWNFRRLPRGVFGPRRSTGSGGGSNRGTWKLTISRGLVHARPIDTRVYGLAASGVQKYSTRDTLPLGPRRPGIFLVSMQQNILLVLQYSPFPDHLTNKEILGYALFSLNTGR